MPLITTLGFAHGIDERAAGGVAQNINRAAFSPVHESLPRIPVDDQFAGFDNLSELVLGVAVDGNSQPIDAGTQVIAGAIIDIDGHAFGQRAQAAADKALPGAVESR